MAPLPPNIPTSFVPRPAGYAERRFKRDWMGAFSIVCYGALVVALALSAGAFIYGRALAASQASKDAALAKALSSIDESQVEKFVQLHDRLSGSATLLANHVQLSNFLDVFDAATPAGVRVSSLTLTAGETGGVVIAAQGAAKDFNVLAAASKSYAAATGIRNAIFSSIGVQKDGSVSFKLAADVDQKLIAYALPQAPAASAPGSVGGATATTTP